MNKPWGIGAWAAEAEREEEEQRRAEAEAAASAAAAAAASSSVAPSSAFPSLSESRSVKPKKKKSISLAEFTTGKPVAPGSRQRLISDAPGLTTEEMFILPKGPRDRSGEEEQRGGLGGGFANYGGGYDRGARPSYERERERDRERDEPSRADESSNWGSRKSMPSGPSFPGERRGSRSDERFLRSEDQPPLPSRADEVDDWGSMKKPLPTVPIGGRRPPTDQIRQPSRADEVDNWVSTKQTPPPPPQSMNTPVHDTVRVHSRADEVDSWLSSKRPSSTDSAAGRSSQDDRWGRKSGNQPYGTEETRRRLVLTPPVDSLVEVNQKPKPNPFGSAKPREEVLAERGLYQSESASKESGSRPSSSHSVTRPETPEILSDSYVKHKPKPNPFGSAKPRELVLEEKGMDWRKIDFDLEHRAVDRPETEEETILKEQIKELVELSKQEAEGGFKTDNGENVAVNGDEIDSLSISERLQMKEKELEQLTRALDDKVRFAQKAIDRANLRLVRKEFPERPLSLPGSRPGSQSGRSDSGRNYDLQEIPGSQLERGLESSENSQLQSLNRSTDRPWSYSGQYERGRNRGQYEGGRNRVQLEGGRDAIERRGSWSGPSENSRSFSSLQRLRQNNSMLQTERGSFTQHPQEAPILDNWNRPIGGDRDGRDWRSQSRMSDRGGVRRL